MSWYVLQCRTGQEDKIIRSCRQHISSNALEEVFSFRCERLWRTDGVWKLVEKEMFPGYVFLESSRPDKLSEELEMCIRDRPPHHTGHGPFRTRPPGLS